MNFITKIILTTLFVTSLPTLAWSARSDADRESLYRYCYMEAVRQQDLGNYDKAYELFRRCLELNPEAAETNFAMGIFNLALGNDSLATDFLRRATEREPENTEFAERLAHVYITSNRMDDATEVYEGIVKQQTNRTEILSTLARIYEQMHEYEKLLSVLDRIEIQEGPSENITLSKMQAYSFKGDQEGAYKELKGLVEAHPNDMNLQVMMGNWLLSNGRKDEALATFLKVLTEEPDNAQGQMSLMDFYRAEGNNAEADRLLYEMLINPRTEPSTRVTMIRQWVKDSEDNGGDSLRVMQMFDHVLELPQKTPEVAEMRVAYMTLKNAPKDSLRAGWKKVLDIAPEYVGARLELIKLMWQDSIDENVIRHCKVATEYVPDEPLLFYYLGLAQYINKHNTEAITSLRRAASNITKETSTNMAADIYALLGDILQKENRLKEAYIAYDSCLVYDANKIMCLNNYAYFLSLENKDLKKAEKMSYRAITAEPENSTYLDTYAWVLYKQQRYEEARIYIEQALRCDTDTMFLTGEIFDHAGDIYYRLGMKEEALEMWQKALAAGMDDMAILRRKIAKKKL